MSGSLFFNGTATTDSYTYRPTLSLHDALPISPNNRNARTPIYPPPRGRHRLTADRRFSTGGGLVSRIVGRGAARLLDRIDSGLEQGSIRLRLPDGSERTLGGRKDRKSVV